jgi:hypothetical protein
MFTTVHPDLRGHYLGASFITQGDLLGVYDHISRLPRNNPIVTIYHDDFLVYAPLTYITHALWLKTISPFINTSLFALFEVDMGAAQAQPGFSGLVFLLKLPYLFVDLICLWIFTRIVEPRHNNQISWLWALNIPILHSGFMMGQFDIFIVLFSLLALFALAKNKPHLAPIFLGLAAGFKPFPLVLILFLPGKLWRNLLIGIGTYLAIITPYLLTSPGFRMYALVAEHSDKLWFAKIPVSGSQYLPLFFLSVFILFWIKHRNSAILPSWFWLATPLLAFYSFTHFHPQWFSWITPFLILALVRIPSGRFPATVLFLCYLAIVFTFESSLNFGLFGINFSLFQFINHYYPTDQLLSLVRAGLAASALALLIVSKQAHK